MLTNTKPATDLFDGIDGIVATEHNNPAHTREEVDALRTELAELQAQHEELFDHHFEQVRGLKSLIRSYQAELDKVRPTSRAATAAPVDFGLAAEVFNFPPLVKPNPNDFVSVGVERMGPATGTAVDYRVTDVPYSFPYPEDIEHEEDEYFRYQLMAEFDAWIATQPNYYDGV